MSRLDSFPLLGEIFDAASEHHLALCCGERAVTYAELRRRVTETADRLARAGLRPRERVALALPKSITTVELILALLAAGAVYVPLSAAQSAERLRTTLHDLDPALVITTPQLARSLYTEWNMGRARPIATLGANGLDLETIVIPATARPAPANVACILYTSGSTGEPKGIMLSHGNIASFVDWGEKTLEIGPADRLASVAPFHFDLSIFDLFCGLSRHASVHLADEAAALFPGQMRAWIDEAKISVWYSVPTVLARLQQRRALKHARSPRLVLFAGEVFPVPILRALMADLPEAEYVNLYGPTETNVCTYHRLTAPPCSDTDNVPIGRPCEHLNVSLRDEEQREVAPGEIGEICVAGPAVMQGYWGRDEMSIAARVAGQAGTYRTGDLGRLRPDGALLFLGRRDNQVKLRGQRVELLALEAVLNAHPAVQESAALVLSDGAGGRLAAFLVPAARSIPDAELRQFVRQRLPASHLPDRFAWLAEMPRTSTGKSDRATLRAMG
jgi:amino acid adenylation domain-containing protein